MVGHIKHKIVRYTKYVGHFRWLRALVALVFLASTAFPILNLIDAAKAYAISPGAEKVIGTANKNLSSKFSYSSQKDAWLFNKDGTALVAAEMAKQQGAPDSNDAAAALSQLAAKQVGGEGKESTSLYSVSLPTNHKRGITYYDNVSNVSFTMVPDFAARPGKLSEDRVVYPFMDGGQIIYTAKGNGLKEDIVLEKYVEDTLRYSYELQLPNTLQAKLLEDGSVGIYSANPAFFGNISYGSETDKAKIMDARVNGSKDHLMFNIPAPFIKDQTGNAGHTKYLLNGNRLTVVAEQLKNLKYPLTIDPSVTVTTSADFQLDSSDEGGGNIDNADQLTRGKTTGGGVGSWAPQTSIPASGSGACGGNADAYGVYNGYLYAVCNNTTTYAKLNANGTINGSWLSGPTVSGIVGRSGFIYNGYFYITGGSSDGLNGTNTVRYSRLNADGSMGAWTLASSLGQARYQHQTVAYNGYLYVTGGLISTLTNVSTANSVERTEIRADGTLGTWSYTTGLTFTRSEHVARVYNGYLYVTGGASSGGQNETVQFARINSDGTLGSWVSTTPIPSGVNNPTYRSGSFTYNGYWYLIGGCDGSCGTGPGAGQRRFLFAPLLASGQVGSWQAGTTLTTDHSQPQVGVYNGYIFSGTGVAQNVYSSLINTFGANNLLSAAADFQASPDGRAGHASIASNGYLYVLGGNNYTGTTPTVTASVQYASFSAAGTVGSWASAGDFTTARVFPAVATRGNYLYLVGGGRTTSSGNCNVGSGSNFYCRDVQKATIAANGTLTWTTLEASSMAGREGMGAVIVGDYLYSYGGRFSGNTQNATEVYVTKLNDTGDIATATTTTTALSTGVSYFGAAANGSDIYAVGGLGSGGGSWKATVNQANGTLGSWTSAGATVSNFSGSADLSKFGFAFNKGVFYISGGQNGTGTRSETQAATLTAAGTLNAWSTQTNSMTNSRSSLASAVSNDYVFTFGGCSTVDCASPTAYKNYQNTFVNNGGNGNTGTVVDSTNNVLPEGRNGAYMFTYNNRMYVVGGVAGSGAQFGGASFALFTTINRNNPTNPGDFNSPTTSWTSAGSAPTQSSAGSNYVFNKGYLYKFGYAIQSNTASTFVEYAPVSAVTGLIGPWTAVSDTMRSGRYNVGVVAEGNYVYVFGGCGGSNGRLDGVCSSWLDTVEVGTINPANGIITSFTQLGAGNNFTTARDGHQAITVNGYVYIIGGCGAIPGLGSACSNIRSDVQYAKLNSGSLAGNAGCGQVWCRAPDTILARHASASLVYGGYIYLIGGIAPGVTLGDIQRAAVSSNGSISRWETAGSSVGARSSAFAAVMYGRLYVAGGNNGVVNNAQNSVAHMPLQIIPNIGNYSKRVTVPLTTEIAAVNYTGSFDENTSVSYRAAPSSGIFGARQAASAGVGSEPTPKCGTGTIYYVQVFANMDDSYRTVFPDTNVASITDFYVYYRLNAFTPAEKRLMGGKWFNNEMQQPLDICNKLPV